MWHSESAHASTPAVGWVLPKRPLICFLQTASTLPPIHCAALLCCNADLLSVDRRAEGTRLAARLNELNEERKVIENGIKDQAIALAEEKYADPVTNPILVLAGTGWHLGVAGIVAARLVAQFQRPALCLSIEGDIARGSGRSIQDVSVLDILRAGDNGLLTRYGGHHAACGCEVPVSRIDELRVSLNAAARKLYPALATRRPPSPVADVKLPSGVKPLPYRHLYPPKICVDARISLSDLTPRFMRQFMALEPFGVGNRRPAFIATARVRSATLTRLEEHCKLVLSDQNGVDVRQIHVRLTSRCTSHRFLALT